MRALVPLAESGTECGSKAATLGELLRAGFAVPGGFVVPADATDGWEVELAEALADLGGGRFAVRSSAAGEDARTASFAGQLESRLDVPAAQVATEIRRTAASGAHADAYGSAVGQAAGPVSVIVQRMLAPLAAGVAFTRHPVTSRRTVLVEAVRGRGDNLVTGGAVPHRCEVGADGLLSSSGPQVLTSPQTEAVARVARQVEACLSGGQDVEWAITPDERLWVLQARPITTGAEARSSGAPARELLARGTPASPGLARGRLRVIGGLDDFARFEPGEILTCRATSPAWTPLLLRAAAVVTEQGGILAHAAIIARELGIPAVTDVRDATTLTDGRSVIVDGTAGTIGTIATGGES